MQQPRHTYNNNNNNNINNQYNNLIDLYQNQIPFEVNIRSLFLQLQSNKQQSSEKISTKTLYSKKPIVKFPLKLPKKKQQSQSLVGQNLEFFINEDYQNPLPKKSETRSNRLLKPPSHNKSHLLPEITKMNSTLNRSSHQSYIPFKNIQSDNKRNENNTTSFKNYIRTSFQDTHIIQHPNQKNLENVYVEDNNLTTSNSFQVYKSCVLSRRQNCDKVKISDLVQLHNRKRYLLNERQKDTGGSMISISNLHNRLNSQ